MNENRYPADTIKVFIRKILQANGVNPEQVESLSKILIWCNLIGRNNHGIIRLPILIERLKKGLINTDCKPVFIESAASLQKLDGDNGFGHYVAEVGMNKAITQAAKHGVGVVVVNNSNFYGAGSYYVNQAAQHNMIGIALSNSFPKVTSYGGTDPVLGTNPFTFGAPNQNGENILFDMATSAVTGSLIREHIRNKELLPDGVAVDSKGNPTTDPQKASEGALLPFAQAKGFGLSIVVELLSGIISGAGISHQVKSMYKNFSENGNNGHFLLALDISKLMTIETYYERLDFFISILKSSSKDNDILFPGETRWNNYKQNLIHGITMKDSTLVILTELAKEHNINFPG